MPLVSSFWLSTKASKKTWIEPVINYAEKTVRFDVKSCNGEPPAPPKLGRGARFRCLVCEQNAEEAYVKEEGRSGRMGQRLMAMVAEGSRCRVYLAPCTKHEIVANSAPEATWAPDQDMPDNPRWFSPPAYGMTTFTDLFTPRQLVALTTFGGLIDEARARALADSEATELTEDCAPLSERGSGRIAYADAIAIYLAFALSKLADYGSSICTWKVDRDSTRNTFSRQAIPMTWDYAELNTLLRGTGSFLGAVNWTAESLDAVPIHSPGLGIVRQHDATQGVARTGLVVSTDPPYYDNISYADLSDFFYVWLRRTLGGVFPDLFTGLLTPKGQELVATPHRFGGSRAAAQKFFQEGLQQSFAAMRAAHDPDYPLTVQYAFKQSESEAIELNGNGTGPLVSTGWEAMLQSLLDAGLAVTGTWPMRTELGNRMIGRGTNSLASSIALVCRPLPEDAPVASRGEFVRALRRELPQALRMLQHGNIAPVDLAQAAIGPGMAIFSRYSRVLEPNGDPLSVRTALGLINQALDEVLAEQEAEYDPDTRLAVAWFEQFGVSEGAYGDAETLAKAKATSVSGLAQAGVLSARAGKVSLIRRDQLPADWDPALDRRSTVWEATQHLIRSLDQGGEKGAARLLARLGAQSDPARDLAYRLYTVAERKGWAQEALAYNSLVVAWSEIARLAANLTTPSPQQERLV